MNFYSVNVHKDGTILDCTKLDQSDTKGKIESMKIIDIKLSEIDMIVEADNESDAIKKADKKRREILDNT